MRLVIGIALIAIAGAAPGSLRAEPPRGAVYTNLDGNCEVYSDEIVIKSAPAIGAATITAFSAHATCTPTARGPVT